MKEVYLKEKIDFGTCEFVVFDRNDDRDTEFVKDGYRYEWVDNFEVGDKFYTIHNDDAEGNFAEDPLNNYYDDVEDAKKRCFDLFGSQDPDNFMGMYVLGWEVGEEEYLDNNYLWSIKVVEE